MKLEKGKVYKCWDKDGNYRLMFSDGKFLYTNSDCKGYNHGIEEFDKVELYEPDTLQEVVDYSVKKRDSIEIKGGCIYWNKEKVSNNWLLNYIRKSDLKNLKALAEKLGYEITKK